MNFIKELLGIGNNGQSEELLKEHCPNCWGDQKYDNLIREKYKDTQISVNNKNSNYAFIQDFIVNQMDGIKLKSSVNGTSCPTCKIEYKENA